MSPVQPATLLFAKHRFLQEPVILNVKGVGYKIHASLAIEEHPPGPVEPRRDKHTADLTSGSSCSKGRVDYVDVFGMDKIESYLTKFKES